MNGLDIILRFFPELIHKKKIDEAELRAKLFLGGLMIFTSSALFTSLALSIIFAFIPITKKCEMELNDNPFRIEFEEVCRTTSATNAVTILISLAIGTHNTRETTALIKDARKRKSLWKED